MAPLDGEVGAGKRARKRPGHHGLGLKPAAPAQTLDARLRAPGRRREGGRAQGGRASEGLIGPDHAAATRWLRASYNSVDNTNVTMYHLLISQAGWNRCN